MVSGRGSGEHDTSERFVSPRRPPPQYSIVPCQEECSRAAVQNRNVCGFLFWNTRAGIAATRGTTYTHTQLDNTRKNGKRRTCNTTLLDDMVVPCALMCMHAARVSTVDQAMPLPCSRGAVVGVCVVDSPHMCILCSCTWNNMQYTNSPYNTACAQVEALYPGCACQVCYLVGTCKVNPTNVWTHMFRHMRRRRVCQQLTKRTLH